MAKKLFFANWKMKLSYKESLKQARLLKSALKDVKDGVVVCPDFLSIAALGKTFQGSNIELGSQDLAAYPNGAYTGEVAASDLYSLGVRYALIGHSERRSYLQESDKLIAAKIRMALANKIKPVLCVGENAAERKQGKAAAVIKNQLKGALQSLSASQLKSVIVAYEPIWSISSTAGALVCSPQEALEIKEKIKEWCQRSGAKSIKILYGGSVNPDNIKGFLPYFDGFLIGSASLKTSSFKKIILA